MEDMIASGLSASDMHVKDWPGVMVDCDCDYTWRTSSVAAMAAIKFQEEL